MKAVFKSNIPYYQVNKSAVLFGSLAYCPEMVFYTDSGFVDRHERELVGKTDGIAYQNESYVFCEGENHNLLTLTDETEISKMREFIEDHPQFEEV